MSRSTIERAVFDQTVTFTSGTTANPVSSIADIRIAEFVGIIGATAFSSTVISLQVSPTSSSDGSWFDLYQANGTKVTIVVSTAESRAYAIDTNPDIMAPWAYMRLVSGSTGEAAGRTLTVFAK